MKLDVLFLSSENADGWHYFPHAAYRIARFCKKYDSDANPLLMVAQLKLAFVRPELGVCVALLMVDGEVKGHALVTMEEWFGTKMATIVQMESDVPVPRKLAQQTLDTIEDWARSRGAQFVQIMARNPIVARVFRTFYKFEEQRVMMRKTLSPVTDEIDTRPDNALPFVAMEQ